MGGSLAAKPWPRGGAGMQIWVVMRNPREKFLTRCKRYFCAQLEFPPKKFLFLYRALNKNCCFALNFYSTANITQPISKILEEALGLNLNLCWTCILVSPNY